MKTVILVQGTPPEGVCSLTRESRARTVGVMNKKKAPKTHDFMIESLNPS